MRLIFDSFWRAFGYLLIPRVIALSLTPLVLMTIATLVLGYFFWSDAVAWVQNGLQSMGFMQSLLSWLEGWGWDGLTAVFASLFVLLVASPLVVIASLLMVSVFMSPLMAKWVLERRFPQMEQSVKASLLKSIWWSVSSTVLALLIMFVSLPLWLFPPLAFLLPPLIWGWLTYRVFANDALADVASENERDQLLARYRPQLWAMGVATGYVGALPSMLWATGAMFIALAPILVPLTVWIYTLIFSFSSLWFTHFSLAALQLLREEESRPSQNVPPLANPELITDVTDQSTRRKHT